MQAPNAQGIMGLMSQGNAPKPPQGAPQQPQPSPMKASPMAAVGSVEDRVAAYRGNPAPLQQRYAMSQDLLDLLALQKIKSEKESAARQMQMQMAQQGAAQGADMTIAQQREKEVMDLTKNELAQQRGTTAQQQVSEQQDALKKLMGGIASAPGAQTAAQPKMMASGGIVAFAEGDPVQDPRRKRGEGESLAEYNRRMLNLELQLRQEAEAKENAEREAERQRRLAERGGAAIPPSRLFNRNPLPVTTAPVASQPAVTGTPLPPTGEGLRGTLGDQMGDFPIVGTRRPPAPPPAPRPAAAPGAAAPGAAPAAGPARGGPAEPPMPVMGEVNLIPGLEQSIRQDVMRDPEAAQRAQEDRIRALYALTPEQRAVYQQGIAQRQKMFDEMYDPERQRQEGIIRFLTGAGGRRYGVLGAGAQESLAYEEAQRKGRLQDFDAMQKAREGLVTLERAGIAPSVEAGLKGLEATSAQRRQGQASGANIYSTESQTRLGQYDAQVRARDAELNREVERARIAATNAANAVQREQLDFSRMQGHLNTVVVNRARAIEAVNKRFAPQLNMLEMQLQAAPNDKKLQEAKAALQLQIDAAVDTVTKPFDESEALIQSRLYGGGGGGTGGYTVRKKESTK
jgi:hypothetical protein